MLAQRSRDICQAFIAFNVGLQNIHLSTGASRSTTGHGGHVRHYIALLQLIRR